MTERYAATVTTRSARATRALGARLGRLLSPGDVVALVGDLGAGKTELVRGACDGAGVAPEEVSSPSFAIVATYRGRIPVHHADLYRIGDPDELYGTGFGDLVGGAGALLVEWADRIPGALPDERLTIALAHDPRAAGVRHLAVEGAGARHAELARQIAARPSKAGAREGRRRSTPASKATPPSPSRSGGKGRGEGAASRSGSGSSSHPRPRRNSTRRRRR